MSYIFQSIKTISYWRYAVLSEDGVKTFFAVLGGIWLIFEIMDSFKVFKYDDLPKYTIYLLLLLSLCIVVITRRPITKIKYKLAGNDLSIEVKIGNLFDQKGQKVISTNTTFDTDIANGIIALNSLQGQFTQTYFSQNIGNLDNIINDALINASYTEYQKVAGKTRKYKMGTTVRVNIVNEVYYLFAMSDLNYDNNAHTTLENVISATESLFSFIAQKGENTDIIVPLFGTGRGRINANRKRVIARISQAFIKASEQQHFSNKIIIIIHPNDAANFQINLYEVRDLLNHYLP